MTKPVRYYRPDLNPDGASFPGVPLADLSAEDFESYPEWVQRSIDASDLYQKTAPRGEVAKLVAEAEAEAETEPAADEEDA